jgi:DNA-binding response OmpR family regulator
MPICDIHLQQRSNKRVEEAPVVLLIDDDPAVLDSLAMLFASHGFCIVTATNGAHGLKLFRERAPMVVVTDIMMPEEDGLGMMRQMRRERPEVKIIVISGGGKVDWSDYLSVAKRLGADAVFRKGTDTGALLETLTKMLPRR